MTHGQAPSCGGKVKCQVVTVVTPRLRITFLTVGTYLAISIGTTTHVQLLLEGPVKLPLLDTQTLGWVP